MSVSALDKPVNHSPPRTPSPKAETKAKEAVTSRGDGQKSTRIDFNSSDNKPVNLSANQAPALQGRSDGRSQGDSRQASAADAQATGVLSKIKQNVKGWCGGRPPKPDPCKPDPCYNKPKPPKPDPCKPDPCYNKPKPPKPDPCKPDPCYGKPKPPKPDPCKPDPCDSKPPVRPTPCKPDPCYGKPPKPDPCKPDPCDSKPPVRPTPCKPDPCYGNRPDPVYSQKSNDDLARMLLNNFDAFKDPKQPWFVTKDGLSDMANKPLTGNTSQDQNIRLARELMKRPELVNALDRHSTTGALDGLIDRQKIQMTLSSQSPMKYQDDNQLAAEMLRHFDALRDPDNRDYISLDKLRGLAQWPTNDPVHGRLAWIAQEVLKRSEVKDTMDGGDRWGKDGWIHKDTLRQMSR